MPESVTKLPDSVAAKLFTDGCVAMFKAWTDYQLILTHADNLPETARELPEDIANWYVEEGLVHVDELDTYLEHFFDESCHSSLSEGTATAFATDLVHLYHICARQDAPAYEAFMRAVVPADIAKSQSGPAMMEEEGSCDSDSEEDLSFAHAAAPAPAPAQRQKKHTTDADGWTTVGR